MKNIKVSYIIPSLVEGSIKKIINTLLKGKGLDIVTNSRILDEYLLLLIMKKELYCILYMMQDI